MYVFCVSFKISPSKNTVVAERHNDFSKFKNDFCDRSMPGIDLHLKVTNQFEYNF